MPFSKVHWLRFSLNTEISGIRQWKMRRLLTRPHSPRTGVITLVGGRGGLQQVSGAKALMPSSRRRRERKHHPGGRRAVRPLEGHGTPPSQRRLLACQLHSGHLLHPPQLNLRLRYTLWRTTRLDIRHCNSLKRGAEPKMMKLTSLLLRYLEFSRTRDILLFRVHRLTVPLHLLFHLRPLLITHRHLLVHLQNLLRNNPWLRIRSCRHLLRLPPDRHRFLLLPAAPWQLSGYLRSISQQTRRM